MPSRARASGESSDFESFWENDSEMKSSADGDASAKESYDFFSDESNDDKNTKEKGNVDKGGTNI